MNVKERMWRELWLREHARDLSRCAGALGLEYHLDLGQQVTYSAARGCRVVYREVFGVDGFDCALEWERDDLLACAPREISVNNGEPQVGAERYTRLKRFVDLFRAHPSDLHAIPDSWVTEVERAVIEHVKVETAERQHLLKMEERRRELEQRALEKWLNPPLVVPMGLRVGRVCTLPCCDRATEVHEPCPTLGERWRAFWRRITRNVLWH